MSAYAKSRMALRLRAAAPALALALGLACLLSARPANGADHGAAPHDTPSTDTHAVESEPLQLRAPPQPSFAVRRIARLREFIARGDAEALSQQADVVRDVGVELAGFDQSVWKDALNRMALVKYVLGGGDPQLLRRIAEDGLFLPDEEPLAHGALAFGEGYRAAASDLLGKVNYRTLPPSLAGHVALVRAVLMAEHDPPEAIRLANEARLLSPGTLVHETAFRVLVESVIRHGDQHLLRRVLPRYLWRFPNTPYFRVIATLLADFIATESMLAESGAVDWICKSIAPLPVPVRLAFLHQLAEAEVRAGHATSAAALSDFALGDMGAVLEGTAWPDAFRVAAMALDIDAKGLAAAVEKVRKANPSEPLVELVAAAGTRAAYISAPPDAQADESLPAPTTSVPTAHAPQPQEDTMATPKTDPAEVLMAAMRTRVAELDVLLRKTTP